VFLLSKSLSPQSPQKTQSRKRSFFCVLGVLGSERLLDFEFHQQSVTDKASPASLVSLYLLFMSLAVSARAMMVWSRLTR
jgi:hypothetical protein